MSSRVFKPPPLGRLRLANVDDAPIIMELMNESMARNFRVHSTPEVVYLIENCVLSICHLDPSDTVVGFLAARDYPLIPSVHPLSWEKYIWTKYRTVEMNARNTLFIHLMVWHSSYGRDVVDSMLKSVFRHDPYVQHIAMMKSLVKYPLLVPGQARSEGSFRRVTALEKGVPGDQLPILFLADRSEVCPRLRIRRAVEEDNDDIVPIIEAHSPKLRELYGDYYISELISRHPESERVLLVCEHKEVAVGVMCLNSLINFEALEESFELSPFAGLRKLSQKPLLKRSKDLDSTASMVNNGTETNTTQALSLPTESMARDKDLKSAITWEFEEDKVGNYISDSHNVPALAQLDILQLLEDDEEELEFDIVNIDTALLRVPQLLDESPAQKKGITKNIRKIFDGFRKESYDEKKREKPKSTTSGTSTKAQEPTRYTGSSNAFLLELFAMHSDYDERYGFDMLEVAFELFPDRDYCIICLPSNNTSFPLLEHFTLVTGYSYRMRFINETLYVTHVNSVRGDLKVRPGEAYDLHGMFDICEHAPRAQGILDLFESALVSNTLQCYVMLSQNQPVGMVVLGPLQDSTSVRTQYDLEPEPRRPGTDGMILSGVLSPVFEPHSRWFMRELLRLSQYSTLFWICRLFAKGDTSPSKHLMSFAGQMAPVHPRHSLPNISGHRDLDSMFNDLSTPYALWVLERPLSSLPKIYVNNSIVVVGASRTGLAFLETLILGPTSQYLTFSNVTLVSEHGLPTVTECLRAADTCVPRDGRYTDRYLKSVPFYFYVDVMSAVMVGIDRKKKCIYLKGGGVKFYDELVLTCGQQFQHPDYLSASLELVKEVEQGKPCDRVLMDDPTYQPDRVPNPPELPENVMLINSLFEANVCLRKLLCMISDTKHTPNCLSEDNQIIVYGDCIEAYSCIAALIELSIFTSLITFVEPFPPEDPKKLRVNCFNNETVDQKMQANLESLGIRIYRKYYLAGWEHRNSHIECINLMSQLHSISLPCFALFYYGLKAIDVSAFKAINESGLVYDGGLVVGPSFETNDPNVYGAGTCVKYSRRLYAYPQSHTYFSSEDVGEALASLFLKKLDPFVMGDPNQAESELIPRFGSSFLAFKGSHGSLSSSISETGISLGISRKWQPVLRFDSPIVQSATLPGPFYYMKLRKAGIEIPMEVQLSLPHQGHILTTDKRDSYFRLHLNALHCVESITCLSDKEFSPEILSQLYGKHEAFFNKLLTRFQMGLIDNLFEFFTQPWMSAMYMEIFQDMLQDINDQDVGTIFDLIKSRFNMYDDTYESTRSMSKTSASRTSNADMLSARASDAESTQFKIDTQMPSGLYGPKEAQKLGTFRQVIDRFVARKSSDQIVNAKTDIPSECGQSAAVRAEAGGFWNTVGGERIVLAHLARYLNRNSVTNPHYAPLNPDLT